MTEYGLIGFDSADDAKTSFEYYRQGNPEVAEYAEQLHVYLHPCGSWAWYLNTEDPDYVPWGSPEASVW